MAAQLEGNAFSKLDTLKAKSIAICLMVFHHMFREPSAFTKDVHLQILKPEIVNTLATNARFCVWIYVFLSAYGMTITYLAGGEKYSKHRARYFLHRILSLQKFYLPFVLIEYILLLIQKPSSELITSPMNIFANVFGIADILGLPLIRGLYWYISFTVLLALFFPLFFDLCERYHFLPILMFAVLQMGYLGEGIHTHNAGAYLNYISAVFAGILFAQNNTWAKLNRKLTPWKSALRLILLLACVIGFPFIRNSELPSTGGIKHWFMTGAAIAVCWMVSAYRIPKLIERFMVFLGKHAANIYLIHRIVLRQLKDVVYFTHQMVLSYLTCMVVSVAISVILTFILEHVGYNRLYRRIDNRLTSGPSVQ